MNKRLKLLDGSEESDYWLGYLAADGCIINNKKYRQYTVNLFTIDDEIKEKYQEYWNNEINYHYRKISKLHHLYFSNLELIKELDKIGITTRKSKTIKLNIPLNPHIVRGIFDGDGWVRKYNSKRMKYESKITTGSTNLMKQLIQYFDTNNLVYKVKQKGNAFDINFYRKLESYKFYKLLYQDATIYMERKYNKFVALFGNKDVIKSGELLENPEEDNQQPSSCGDTEKGSTTSSESQVDNNSTTSAGLPIVNGR